MICAKIYIQRHPSLAWPLNERPFINDSLRIRCLSFSLFVMTWFNNDIRNKNTIHRHDVINICACTYHRPRLAWPLKRSCTDESLRIRCAPPLSLFSMIRYIYIYITINIIIIAWPLKRSCTNESLRIRCRSHASAATAAARRCPLYSTWCDVTIISLYSTWCAM